MTDNFPPREVVKGLISTCEVHLKRSPSDSLNVQGSLTLTALYRSRVDHLNCRKPVVCPYDATVPRWTDAPQIETRCVPGRKWPLSLKISRVFNSIPLMSLRTKTISSRCWGSKQRPLTSEWLTFPDVQLFWMVLLPSAIWKTSWIYSILLHILKKPALISQKSVNNYSKSIYIYIYISGTNSISHAA